MTETSRIAVDASKAVFTPHATAVVRHAKSGRLDGSEWLPRLLERKPRKLAAVALANKMARIVWAMTTRGEAYRPAQAAA